MKREILKDLEFWEQLEKDIKALREAMEKIAETFGRVEPQPPIKPKQYEK